MPDYIDLKRLRLAIETLKGYPPTCLNKLRIGADGQAAYQVLDETLEALAGVANSNRTWADLNDLTDGAPPRDHCRRSEHQQRIDEFMKNAKQALPSEPCVPPPEVRNTRASLILEECLETIEALGFEAAVTYCQGKRVVSLHSCREPNLTEIADGCADISVVTIGTLSACGISDVELLEEVDRSNLSKFILPKCAIHGDTMFQVSPNWPAYKCGWASGSNLGRQECAYHANGPYMKDGKWIKGPDCKPPDIEAVLCRQYFSKHPEEVQAHLKEIEPEIKPLAERACTILDQMSKDSVDPDPLYKAMVADDIVKAGSEPSICAGVDPTAAEAKAYLDARYPPDLLERAKEHLVALHEFDAAAILVEVIQRQKAREAPPPTVKDRPGDMAEGLFNEGATRGTVTTPLCGSCKGPLSHKLYRDLLNPANRKNVYRCPNCMNILLSKEITIA